MKNIMYVLLILIVTVTSISIFLSYRKIREITINQSGGDKEYRFHYMMIGDSSEDGQWLSIYEGAHTHGLSLDAYVENFGQNLMKDYTTEELMEMAIASKPDGIMLKGTHSERLQELVDEAGENNIPVVTILRDVNSSKRKSFVSSNDYTVGQLYGSQLVRLSRTALQETGSAALKVSVLVDASGELTVPNLIYSGIKDAVGDQNSIIDISAVSLGNAEDFEAEEHIRELLLNEEERPDVIIGLSAVNTLTAYQSMIDYNLVGKVTLLGTSVTEKILDGISKNIIDSTVAINEEELGKQCVTTLNDFVLNGYISEYKTVEPELVTTKNVNEYKER